MASPMHKKGRKVMKGLTGGKINKSASASQFSGPARDQQKHLMMPNQKQSSGQMLEKIMRMTRGNGAANGAS